jgi:hypothetical protein
VCFLLWTLFGSENISKPKTLFFVPIFAFYYRVTGYSFVFILPVCTQPSASLWYGTRKGRPQIRNPLSQAEYKYTSFICTQKRSCPPLPSFKALNVVSVCWDTTEYFIAYVCSTEQMFIRYNYAKKLSMQTIKKRTSTKGSHFTWAGITHLNEQARKGRHWNWKINCHFTCADVALLT